MIFELRIYECAPGRLNALHDRFRTLTSRMFKKHDIKVVGYWVDKYGISNRLTWMIQWESEADREKKWGAFTTDPEWLDGRAKSELPENGGPIVARVTNTIMTGTDYSPLK